jgi:hypothetical protein
MGRSTGIPERAIIEVAIRTLGLSEVKAFDPAELVIEYRLSDPAKLAAMTLRGFIDELSSDSPAPGGGSVSALVASLGAGLAAMVANLSHPKKGFEALQPRLDAIAVRGQQLKDQLLAAVDADTAAFDGLLEAMRLPKGTPEAHPARLAARHGPAGQPEAHAAARRLQKLGRFTKTPGHLAVQCQAPLLGHAVGHGSHRGISIGSSHETRTCRGALVSFAASPSNAFARQRDPSLL